MGIGEAVDSGVAPATPLSSATALLRLTGEPTATSLNPPSVRAPSVLTPGTGDEVETWKAAVKGTNERSATMITTVGLETKLRLHASLSVAQVKVMMAAAMLLHQAGEGG